jgi:uncharacterized membrane protein
VLAAACSGGEQLPGFTSGAPSSPGAPHLTTFAYDCEDGRYLVANFPADTDAVWLFLPGGTVQLPRSRADSGARYADEAVSFLVAGERDALLETDGRATACTENRRATLMEDAKLRGVDFRATGNEPGWWMEIGPDATILVTDYGQQRDIFATPEPEEDRTARRTTYWATSGGRDVQIVLIGEPCQDSMRGDSFQTTVQIRLGQASLTGCGQALH